MSTRSRRQWLQPHMVHATDSMSTQVSLILQECSLVTRSANPELSVLVLRGNWFHTSGRPRGFVPDVRLPSIGECATIVAAVQLSTLVRTQHDLAPKRAW